MVEITTVQTMLLGIGAGILTAVRLWWGRKTMLQKKDAFKDALDACEDKRISIDEVKAYIDEHF